MCSICTESSLSSRGTVCQSLVWSSKNADVERHLELEEKFYSKYHKERIKQGEIVGWDLWQILNPDVNEMTTTFIYAHLTTSPVGGNFPAITSLKGVSSTAWEAAQKEAMGHYIKNYQVLVSLKGVMVHKRLENQRSMPF